MESLLTHWGRVTHICVSKLAIIGADNGLSPGRRQAIISTNDGILLIRTSRTHFSEIVSKIHTFSFKKMYFKMSSGKWRPSCLGLNVLIVQRATFYSFMVVFSVTKEAQHHRQAVGKDCTCGSGKYILIVLMSWLIAIMHIVYDIHHLRAC